MKNNKLFDDKRIVVALILSLGSILMIFGVIFYALMFLSIVNKSAEMIQIVNDTNQTISIRPIYWQKVSESITRDCPLDSCDKKIEPGQSVTLSAQEAILAYIELQVANGGAKYFCLPDSFVSDAQYAWSTFKEIIPDNTTPESIYLKCKGTDSIIFDKDTDNNPVPTKTTNTSVINLEKTYTWNANTVCVAEPIQTDIGRAVYPIYPKYADLDFLGQIFTASDCGMDRVNEVFGVEDGEYTLGSYIWLKDKPSKDLVNTFIDIGYKCDEEKPDEDCLEWELLEAVSVDELMRLEPFYNSIKQDDCRYCG
ncbi:MAG: hypothetical protein P1P90_06815 [Patescibacteria group bacterium]|nr:hypothetical protein [Patescibacteria group bacterium]